MTVREGKRDCYHLKDFGSGEWQVDFASIPHPPASRTLYSYLPPFNDKEYGS